MGVPTLGCHCRVCDSKDPRDNRLRPSLLLSHDGHNVVVDTTPDFRQQALRAGVDRLDAVFLTSFVFAFLCIVEVTLVYVLQSRKKSALADKMRRTARWAFPATYVLLLLLLIVIFWS